MAQVIVIGGTGQTGHRVLELLLSADFGKLKVLATSRKIDGHMPAGPLASTIRADALKWQDGVQWCELDFEAEQDRFLAQLEAISAGLDRSQQTWLIVAAAFTNVDGCETDPAYCEKVNQTNTVEVMRWAKENFKAKVVFYSTDYVFDGLKGQYKEEDRRNAVCVYGQSKVYVEEWLEKNAPEALILRTTGVYDYLPGSKNFLMQMIELWGQGKQTRIPSDQEANPVWAKELAQATIDLLKKGSRGIFHVAGGTQFKRTDFAATIARIFGLDPNLIVPIETWQLNQKAKRPLKGGLSCEKLRKEIGWAPRGAAEVLKSLKSLHQP